MRYVVLFFLIAGLMAYMVSHDHLSDYWRGQSMPWDSWPTRGQLAPNDPVQTLFPAGSVATWSFHGDTITALAGYSITARFLHRATYVGQLHGDIAPVDFALGWGPMSDPSIYKQLDIGQSGRWYSWQYDSEPPIADDQIVSHSSNNHLVPATDAVRDQLLALTVGDVIQLTGYLIEVDGPDFRWRSSLSRTDTGDGACELMWVEHAAKVGR